MMDTSLSKYLTFAVHADAVLIMNSSPVVNLTYLP